MAQGCRRRRRASVMGAGRNFFCPFFRAGQSEMQKEAAGAPGLVGQDAWDEGG